MYQSQSPSFDEILQVLSFAYPHYNLRIVIPGCRSRHNIQNDMSEILLCLAIIFPAKLASSGRVARNSDLIWNSNGIVGREPESRLLGVVQQAFRMYLD